MASLLSDLADVGFHVKSAMDLPNSGMRYKEAIPVLLKWLPLTPKPIDKEWIVRALSVPWAKPDAVEPLLAQFQAEPAPSSNELEEGLRWAVGNAIDALYDDSIFDTVARLVSDRRYGRAREMLALALRKSKRPEAVSLLISLVSDPDVDGHAVDALGKFKDPASREALLTKVNDKRTWVRKSAIRTLAKIDQQYPPNN